MASLRRLAANRGNALRSTGPRSRDGKARASRNARRHGLAAFAMWAGPLAPDLERLTDEIAGPAPYSCRWHFANMAAAAELELRRVRAARLALLARMGDLVSSTDQSDLEDRDGPGDAHAAAEILKRLSRLDRYEHRAASRRNRALRLL